MKKNSLQQSTVIDKNYISSIYSHLTEKINMLDELNQQYKKKQEGHFLKTFMAIIEKLGNELIFAQEAYKNVDIQAKKDSYCLQLAEQLNFFKTQSVNLSNHLNAANQELKKVKLQKQNLQNELNFTRDLYEKQTSNNIKLKSEIKQLKKQLKTYMATSSHHTTNSIVSQKLVAQNNKQLTSLSLGKKLFSKRTDNPESLEQSEQISILKNYETFDSFPFDRKSRNSMTLTPVGEIARMPQHMNATQRMFRARKQSKQMKSNLPKQYLVS